MARASSMLFPNSVEIRKREANKWLSSIKKYKLQICYVGKYCTGKEKTVPWIMKTKHQIPTKSQT